MMLPNVVIAGAPKCGTTSLFNWLADHPEVGSTEEKEIFYLLDKDFWIIDKKFNYHTHGLKGYETFFSHCTGKKIVMEGSTPYLYQETARTVLATLLPKPRIIFVLREPAARLYSNYKYFFNNKATEKTDMTFREYYEAITQKTFLSENQQIQNAFEHGCYVTYLEKWLEAFGQENVKVVFFEQLVTNTTDGVSQIACWLGIDPSFYGSYEFKAENSSFELKNFYLHRWSRWLAKNMPKTPLRNSLKTLYRNVNTKKPAGKTDDDLVTLAVVKQRYEPWNRGLFELLGVNNVW
jgi:hypothetical protein